ncbi:MAG: S41 family peptidase [Planctomycetota bacterium]
MLLRSGFLAVCLLSIPSNAAALEEARPLLRFPDVHGDQIVFSYGEDLWSASTKGGIAVRLTLHDGEEESPNFSPDGQRIAFTGEYDGNTDVYVMDAHGGDITRVTWHPGEDAVVGWHPTNGKILFRSSRDAFSRFEQLYLISPDGTGLERLMMHEAAFGSFSPDGQQIAYNRVRREHRTWKRYVGGLAQDLYLFDLNSHEDRRLTTFEGTDRLPMWIGDTIFFSSDRDRVLNIYGYDVKTGQIEQITHHENYDVRRPSMGSGQIVYEVGGELWLLDTASGKSRAVPIEIRSDAPEARPYRKDVSGDVTQIDISPGGERALIVARGEVFSVPKENGATRNLSRSCGSHEKDAVWSPDGKTVAWLSDVSGEYAIHLVDPLGKREAIQLTSHRNGYRHTLRWSPDSKKIAFADQTLRCYYVDVDSKRITEVDRSDSEPVDIGLDLKPINDFRWSPDSRFLAYSKIDADLVSRIYIHSLEAGENHRISGDLFNDFQPVFTRDGKHLLFVSNRRFDPTLCDFEWEMVYKRVAGIYAVTLAKDGQPLLPLESDEVVVKEPEEKKEEAGSPEAAVRIDFEGIAERVEALPLPRGNYRDLQVNDKALFYLNADEGDFNRFEYRAVGPRTLSAFSFEDREASEVVSGVDQYRLSADGSELIYQSGQSVKVTAAKPKAGAGEAVSLADLEMWFDPRQEWQQIYNEAWRMERDFYYEPSMHGLDWDAVRVKYGRLVPFASCRQDLRFLIGEMIGELNTSHTYVSGGDVRRTADRVNVGLLGADWELDATSSRYRLTKIYAVPDWTLGVHPPLTRPGLDVRQGDLLISVNGADVTGARNLFSYFEDLAGEQVTLMFNTQPTLEGAREVVTVPLSSERTLRYRDWLERNRRAVDEASNGLVGYLHLPDTYLGSCREFPKYFYSQTQKKGLIVDGRFNGGGLDPDIFLQRLGKQQLAWWTRRYSQPQTTPAVVTRAHLALLTNRQAGSGGDMLPMEFQQKKLGPVIGTRTWGGLVGVSTFMTLIDGGSLSAPDYRIYTPEGHWIVENEGVTPDIEVDLTPAEVARGFDAQLMKGVEVVLKKIREEPRERPPHEPFPQDG